MAVAEKPSACRKTFSLEHGGERYELRRESPWRSSFVLSRTGVGVVGSIRQKTFFGRETKVELQEELPIEVVVFVLWLATIMPDAQQQYEMRQPVRMHRRQVLARFRPRGCIPGTIRLPCRRSLPSHRLGPTARLPAGCSG